MFKLFVIAALVCLAAARSDDDWRKFKSKFDKAYPDQKEEKHRRGIWEDNMKKVDNQNEKYRNGKSSFHCAENSFADQAAHEMKSRKGLKVPSNRPTTSNVQRGVEASSLPDSINWVSKGYVTAVKNQGQCGSCWTFSATGAMEGYHFGQTGQLVNLSESNILDCAGPYGGNGCSGGYMSDAFNYIINNNGQDSLESYPYKPENQPCAYTVAGKAATLSQFQWVTPQGDESALQQAVAKSVTCVGINAESTEFQMYSGGVFDYPECSQALDHGVLAVGYGSDNGKDYWLVKNSWGTAWGEQGYVKMSRNANDQCGIAMEAVYPGA